MKKITLPDTDLSLSRLSFGTASLHHLFDTAKQDDLLRGACDAGFSHFDTSPYYGFGIAEKALGRLPSSLKDNMTIASKVGLYSPAGASAHIASVLLRKVAGKIVPALNKPMVDWHIATAQKSLEDSLRRLRRSHVDILFLHEPNSALIATDAWQQWLQERVQAGQVRHWGIAGEAHCIDDMLKHSPSLAQVVQVRDSLNARQADVVKDKRALQLTYGYMSGNTQQVPVETLLQGALARNTTGAIIVSTRQLARVQSLASIVDTATNN